MQRRQFLKAGAAASICLTQVDDLLAIDKDNRYRKEIGIQLYTLRNEIAKDTAGTIQAVADAGYKQVELYGFPDCQPMLDAAKKSGLKANSAHFQWNSVVNPDDKGIPPFAKILDKANEAGISHLVIPYLEDRNRRSLDDYKQVADRCNDAAELAKKAGVQLAYHNHAFEFQPFDDKGTGYEVFTERFAPAMHFEIDVFWVKVGGQDPLEWMKKLKGRVSQLHLKDLKKGIELPAYGGVPKDAFKELGNGSIPMDPIIELAAHVGVKICHVEQDQSPNPLASIKESMKYLRSL